MSLPTPQSTTVADDTTSTVGTKAALLGWWAYLRPHRIVIAISVVLALAGAVLNLFGPNMLAEITNLITEGLAAGNIDLETIGRIGVTLTVIYLFGFAFNYIQSLLMVNVAQDVTRTMRRDVVGKINRLPLSYLDRHPSGDIRSRVTNDVDTVGSAMNQTLSSLVSSAALFVGSAAMMLITNWIMALAGIAAAVVGMLLMLFVAGGSQRYFASQQATLGRLNAHVEETYTGHDVIAAYNGQDKGRREFHEMNDQLYASAWRSQFFSGLTMPIMSFIGNLAFVVVCVVGGILAVQGSVTIGTIVAFMVYIRLFTSPLQSLAQAVTQLQSMTAAAGRVVSFLDETEMAAEADIVDQLADVDGEVNFEHVKFGYVPDRIIIKDFSTDVAAGQKVAIVGPSGSGKTTLVNLLMRFYEIDSGKIAVDGVPIRSVTRANLRDQFAMVLQETWIFQGTLRENLVYNQTNISAARLDEVSQAAGLASLIARLPEGYDTMLDEATTLSVGESQLITIARSMLADAPLTILDEATSSVDTRTEAHVQAAMDKLTHGRTSFVIAHRLSTIRNSDLILVLRDGDVVESGTHDELLAKAGFYAELYNSQFDPE